MTKKGIPNYFEEDQPPHRNTGHDDEEDRADDVAKTEEDFPDNLIGERWTQMKRARRFTHGETDVFSSCSRIPDSCLNEREDDSQARENTNGNPNVANVIAQIHQILRLKVDLNRKDLLSLNREKWAERSLIFSHRELNRHSFIDRSKDHSHLNTGTLTQIRLNEFSVFNDDHRRLHVTRSAG
jgi:hypothetical protein